MSGGVWHWAGEVREAMKNEDVLEVLQRRFGALAEKLEEESMACSMAAIDVEGR